MAERLKNWQEEAKHFQNWETHRFIVKFPNEFSIPYYYIVACTLPNKKYEGELSFSLYCPIVYNNTSFDGKPEPFDMEIALLDERGKETLMYKLSECSIVEVDNTTVSYADGIEFQTPKRIFGKIKVKY